MKGSGSMESVHDILELPVIDAQEGRELGVVIDVVLKVGADYIAGIILKSKDNQYLVAPTQLYSLGTDYVIIKEKGNLLEVNSDDLLTAQDLIGTQVVTNKGNSLGVVKDVLLSEDGKLNGYELSDGLVQDILTGREVLAADKKITYGNQKIIIEDHLN